MNRPAAAASVAIHALLLLSLAAAPDRPVATPPKPPARAVDATLWPADHLTGEEAAGAGLACGGYHYNGIGLTHGAGTGRVIDVGRGTPAERAGLQAGDVLLNGDLLEPDRFPPGTELVLRFLRDGRELSTRIRIGRICNDT